MDIKMPGISSGSFSDENLKEFLRLGASTVYHPVGTCKMGAINDDTAVVDPTLRYAFIVIRR